MMNYLHFKRKNMSKIKRLSNEEKQECVELTKEGMSYEQIALKLGVTGKVIRDWVLKLAPELVVHNANNNKDKIQQVIDLYHAGGTYVSIAQQVGVGKSTVVRWVKQHALDKLTENKNKFSQEVKDKALLLMRTELNYTSVANQLGLHPTTVRDWVLNLEPEIAVRMQEYDDLLDNKDLILGHFDSGVSVKEIVRLVGIGEKRIRILLKEHRPKYELMNKAVELCQQSLSYVEIGKQLNKTDKTIGDWIKLLDPELAKTNSSKYNDLFESVLNLYKQNIDIDAISKTLNLKPNSIYRWIQDFVGSTVITTEQKQEFLNLKKQGNTFKEIGLLLNIHPHTLRVKFSSYDLSFQKEVLFKKSTPEIRNEASTLFENGVNIVDISIQLGFHVGTITKWLKKLYPDKFKQLKAAIPVHEEQNVKQMLDSKTFTYKEIGEMLLCSGNAIRDFAIKHNLQHTQSEISAYLASIGKQRVNGVKAMVNTKFGILICDSSYEVAQLLQWIKQDNITNIARAKVIPLSNGRNYAPDFHVSYVDGTEIVTEIKAKWETTTDKVITKVKCAREYFANSCIEYKVITEFDLGEQAFYNALQLLIDNSSLITLNSDNDRIRLIKAIKSTISGLNKIEGVNRSLRITNGTINKGISPDEPIPDGWRKGVTRKKKETQND